MSAPKDYGRGQNDCCLAWAVQCLGMQPESYHVLFFEDFSVLYMNERHIRIHGDNIVECERTLNMIVEALQDIPCNQCSRSQICGCTDATDV